MKALATAIVIFAVQFILQKAAYSQVWVQATNAPSKEWWSVASSADGMKLAAAVYNGGIYTSTNAGLTWTSNTTPAEAWYSVASSADGTKLAAAVNQASSSGGGIFTNSGTTWTASSAPNHLENWYNVIFSTNGNTLMACGAVAASGFPHVVYTSSDSGNTWNNANLPNLVWFALASSANGTKLYALANATNIFYSSSDSGSTWISNSMPNNTWYCAASSADGTKLTAGSGVSIKGGIIGDGLLYTSTNSGASWVPDNVPSQNWYSVASSADGTKLVACGFNSYSSVYTSTNSGQTWTSNNIPNTYSWASVASSADGSRLVAVSATGQIYTSVPNSPPLSGELSGANFALTWPAGAIGFQLQQSLALTNNWTAVTNSVAIMNGQNQVIVPATNKQTFYRLINQ